jgi:predicted nucleic acid-binding protein
MTIYVDTNVFVYWLTSHPVHGEAAEKLIKIIEAGETAITSALTLVQVDWAMRALLQAKLIQKYDLHKMVESVGGIQNLRIVELRDETCKRALRHTKKYGLDLEDSIHLETALKRKCSEIFSADVDFDKGPLPRRF